jgi:hypothetical protein
MDPLQGSNGMVLWKKVGTLCRFSALGAAVWVMALVGQTARALENAKVMPQGISRFNLRVVNTTIREKTDDQGQARPLAQPLSKDLTFKDVLQGEKDPLKRELTAGFLLANGLAESATLGSFGADLAGRVTVYAPIYSFGITDRLTLAATVPVYQASMNVSVGFRANSGSQTFRDTLVSGFNNQAEGARDFVSRINDAVGRLGSKLTENGYRELEPWQETALGDAQLLAKYALVQGGPVQMAVMAGAVAPTGRVDDPDNLIDVGFGDGQWDGLVQLSLDQPVGQSGMFFNQYARYTAQFEDQPTLRMKTADEVIEVPKKRVQRDLGDKLNAGVSVQFEGPSGLTAGTGYNYFYKGQDVVKGAPTASQNEWQRDTLQRAHEAEVSVGYSAVPAFRRKEVAVPFELSLSYRHQMFSDNMPVAHQLQFESGIFF